MEERLQKVLAAAGVASRRASERLISEGRVSVNGVVVTRLGTRVDPERDAITVDGKTVPRLPSHGPGSIVRVTIALNKPEGYVCTVKDPHAPHTVMELVRAVGQRIYPIGRLDAGTSGLLLLTNDGDLAQHLMHPRNAIPKVYRVVARGRVSEFALTDLRQGILLEDGMTLPAQVEVVQYDEAHNTTVLDITLFEGRNRQLRRMMQTVGHPVLALTRLSVGPISVKGLAPGTWRKLRQWEIAALRAAADGSPSEPEAGNG
ncbi:MAG: pseudouridine synthase [Chthonomonadales bacterium]